MKCPKCGFEQPQAEECLSCGIIIEKYHPQPMRQARPSPLPGPEPSSKENAPSAVSIKNYVIASLVIVFVLFAGLHWWNSRPITHGPGVIAPNPPKQTESAKAPFSFEEYRITPLGGFEVNARVLCRKKYSFGKEADLAPVDLALGWGRMSDETVIDKLDIHQSNRFYFWQSKTLPIPRKEINTHSANMHLIAADASIKKRIKKVRVGHIVEFSGHLVKATHKKEHWNWKSSLSRTDTGRGACEVVFVETFRILDHRMEPNGV